MIIYLSGQDTYRSRERLRQLREAFIKKFDSSGLNVQRLSGDGLKFEDFQQAASSQGFLSSRRFVTVERPFEADGKVQAAIADFIKAKSVPEASIVVFWSGEEREKKKKSAAREENTLENILKKSKNHEIFRPLDALEVEQWITKQVKERGATIDRAAVERLASATGSDLWLVSNEIEKFVHLRKGLPITSKDIDEYISADVDANIFEFTDALSRKDGSAALALLERQFSSGANELYLLTMIARQIRILISVADVAASESNASTIASRLELHPFVVKKALQQVRTFSRSELLQAHAAVTEIDFRLKSSRDNPRALLELFVLRFCQPVR